MYGMQVEIMGCRKKRPLLFRSKNKEERSKRTENRKKKSCPCLFFVDQSPNRTGEVQAIAVPKTLASLGSEELKRTVFVEVEAWLH